MTVNNIDIQIASLLSFHAYPVSIFSLLTIDRENRLLVVKSVFRLLGRTVAGCTILERYDKARPVFQVTLYLHWLENWLRIIKSYIKYAHRFIIWYLFTA